MATIIFHDLTPRREPNPQPDPKQDKPTPDIGGQKHRVTLSEGEILRIIFNIIIIGVGCFGLAYMIRYFRDDFFKGNFRLQYQGTSYIPGHHYYKVAKDERWGIYDTIRGKEIIAPKYDDIDFFYDDKPTRYELNKKFGFVNREGVEITSAKFEDARNFFNDRAAVCLNGLWGFINTRGEVVIEIKYREVKDFYHPYGLVDKTKVRLGKEWFTIDKQGRRVEE